MTINQAPLDKEQLLKELDALGYSDRMKRMALLGRDHGRVPGYSALHVALLNSGSAYEAHQFMCRESEIYELNPQEMWASWETLS